MNFLYGRHFSTALDGSATMNRRSMAVSAGYPEIGNVSGNILRARGRERARVCQAHVGRDHEKKRGGSHARIHRERQEEEQPAVKPGSIRRRRVGRESMHGNRRTTWRGSLRGSLSARTSVRLSSRARPFAPSAASSSCVSRVSPERENVVIVVVVALVSTVHQPVASIGSV